MKGNYLLTAVKPDGTVVRNIPATFEWVEANFKPSVLAAAQRAYWNAMKKFDVKEVGGVRKRTQLSGFVDVQAEGIVVTLDEEQINQLRYLPAKMGVYGDQYQKKNVGLGGLRTWVYETDDKGNRIKVAYEDKEKRELPAKWQGLCTATQKCHDLTDAFVEQNFSPSLGSK